MGGPTPHSPLMAVSVAVKLAVQIAFSLATNSSPPIFILTPINIIMELDEHGFLEELLALKRDSHAWEDSAFPFFSSSAVYDVNSAAFAPPLFTPEPAFDCLNEVCWPTTTATVAEAHSSPAQSSGLDVKEHLKAESSGGLEPGVPAVFGASPCLERKNKKKAGDVPSKNLMAERRRRKRLNDRLSMLRSVVPKISKMDRTSILGDTIDYMKELLDRIKKLQEEIDEVGSGQASSNLLGIFKDLSPNEVLVRNSPKFDVERRDRDTRIEICCAAKPGLLLSTISALEAVGLEIQQCVVSCFNDFGLQASCSEELEQRAVIRSEDIKQALLRNAGYGGS